MTSWEELGCNFTVSEQLEIKSELFNKPALFLPHFNLTFCLQGGLVEIEGIAVLGPITDASWLYDSMHHKL